MTSFEIVTPAEGMPTTLRPKGRDRPATVSDTGKPAHTWRADGVSVIVGKGSVMIVTEVRGLIQVPVPAQSNGSTCVPAPDGGNDSNGTVVPPTPVVLTVVVGHRAVSEMGVPASTVNEETTTGLGVGKAVVDKPTVVTGVPATEATILRLFTPLVRPVTVRTPLGSRAEAVIPAGPVTLILTKGFVPANVKLVGNTVSESGWLRQTGPLFNTLNSSGSTVAVITRTGLRQPLSLHKIDKLCTPTAVVGMGIIPVRLARLLRFTSVPVGQRPDNERVLPTKAVSVGGWLGMAGCTTLRLNVVLANGTPDRLTVMVIG